MSQWSSSKGRQILAALQQIGWQIKRQSGSHIVLEREDYPDYVFRSERVMRLNQGCLPELLKKPG